MTQSHKARHYLAALYPNDNTPKQYRKVNLVARALFPAPGLKSLYSLQVRIVSISETGAILQSRAIDYLPDHFYLCFGEREILITCAKKSLLNGSVVASFAKAEAPGFIDALTRITFPLVTLKKLGGICPPAIAARITRTATPN